MMTQTIGQQLQQARKGRDATLEEAEKATHIRVRYLLALETDDLELLPSKVQGRGFLRLYADYLGLNVRSLLDLWDGKTPLHEEPQPAEQAAPTAGAEGGSPPVASPSPPTGSLPEPPPAEVSAPLPTPARIERITAVQPALTGESAAIFRALGDKLRSRRESLHLEMEDVERQTKVRAHYLSALENGLINDLPSPVQGRGMLSNYAHFLNLDVDNLLLRFAEGLQAQRMERLALETTPQPQPSRARVAPRFSPRRFISVDLIVVVVLVISVLGVLVWGAAQVAAIRSQEPVQGTLPAVAEVLLASPSATLATPSPASQTGAGPTLTPTLPNPVVGPEGESTLSVTLPPEAEGTVQIVVVAKQRAWMRVLVDGKEAFIGRVTPGSAYPFTGSRRIELTTGSGAAIQVFYKQNDLGQLGLVGQVVNLVFTRDGMETPVPTATPTPSQTPPPAPTAMPTNTLPPPPPTATVTPAS